MCVGLLVRVGVGEQTIEPSNMVYRLNERGGPES